MVSLFLLLDLWYICILSLWSMGPILTFPQGYPFFFQQHLMESSHFHQCFELPPLSYKFTYAPGFTSRFFSSFPLVFLFISLKRWTMLNYGGFIVYLVGIIPPHCFTFSWVSLLFLHVHCSWISGTICITPENDLFYWDHIKIMN